MTPEPLQVRAFFMGIFNRLSQTWKFFQYGIGGLSQEIKQAALYQLNWKSDKPIWNTVDFLAYVKEGFNLNSVVYSAIMYKSRAKMSAPLRAFTGSLEQPELLPPDHPLSRLVSRPNPHQSGAEFQQQGEIYFNLGNTFILLVKPPKGGSSLPTAMYNLRPDRIRIVLGDSGILGYVYVPEGAREDEGLPILAEDMIHVKLPNPGDPLEGLGWGMPPTSIGQSVDVDNDVTRFLKMFFQNGAMIFGVLQFDVPMDNDTIAAVKQRWSELYGGVDNWLEPGVLDQGGKYQRVGATFEEMGFDSVDERTELRILSAFGVPALLLGTRAGMRRSTLNNLENARRIFWEDTALPEMRLFEAEYQYHLNQPDGSFVSFDLRNVPALRKDTPRLVEAAWRLWTMGMPSDLAISNVGLSFENAEGGHIGYVPTSVVAVSKEDPPPEFPMSGSVTAENDERNKNTGKTLTDWMNNKESITLAESIICPLCQKPGVNIHHDHGGLCVCTNCKKTFDPDFHGVVLNGHSA